jgi:capsular polysaccharide biosynthesis protein
MAVDNLYFVAARSTVYDSSPPPNVEQVVFSPKILKKQRQWLLEGVSDRNKNNLQERLFLLRKSKYRNLLNAEQVGRYLEDFGFYAPEIGEDFFTRQHIYFSRANLIVGPGGAILANILFMKKGSKVIAMRSWRDSKLNLWKSLAEACNVEYGEIIGIPTYFGRKFLARQHSNYFIPLVLVKKLIKR